MNNQINKSKQTFTYTAPGAVSVLLAGDFTHWQSAPLPLQKQSNGTWKITASLTPGTHHYRFIVDGEWRDDPDCELRVDNPFGTKDDVVKVPPAQ